MDNSSFLKVLIISDAAWRDDNNIGSTFNDIFTGWPKDQIAMIYGRPELPSTNICEVFYQLSESRIIKKIINKSLTVGQIVANESSTDKSIIESQLNNDIEFGHLLYSFFRRFRFTAMLLARECLWKFINWNNEAIFDFVDHFQPDIIFNLATPGIYMNKIQRMIIKHYQCKSVLYFVDDLYSMKQFSLSPLFWFYRLAQRNVIRKTVSETSQVFVISEKMKEEYDSIFKVDSQILTKRRDFSNVVVDKKSITNVENNLVLTYTGNLLYGRFSTIRNIGLAIDKYNLMHHTEHKLYIYSATALTDSQTRLFKNSKSICFKGKVSADQAILAQLDSDVLIHVESFNLKERLLTRLSFSTKLVDYFTSGKCIFAVGSLDSASILYLNKNKAAFIATKKSEIYHVLDNMLQNAELRYSIANNAISLGRQNHDLTSYQNPLVK